MPGNNYFQFKRFKIIQEQSAMKVGTDGVLLGAWTESINAEKILDVGTGTGLIALMLAQKSDAEITGLEIEKNAATEAQQNAYNSPWSARIRIINKSFQEFAKQTDEKFDVIVSNPPFFINDKRSEDYRLSIARHSDKLPLCDLAGNSEKLIAKNGILTLILPVVSAEKFINKAESHGLFLSKITEVKHKGNNKPHRFLMEFRRKATHPEKGSISIRNTKNDDFTEAYKNLTRDYYLNF
jgi:tRNA1Val (adenine37-N6)-methyltransferase